MLKFSVWCKSSNISKLAKCLKYLGFGVVCDVVFGVFLVSWILTRHVLYTMACWSVYVDTDKVLPESCWRGRSQSLEGPLPTPQGSYLLEPLWDPQGLVCWNKTVKWWFLIPLLLLQCLNFVWLYMIVRVAVKVIRKEGAEDSRSDDEDEDTQDEHVAHESLSLDEKTTIFEERPHNG